MQIATPRLLIRPLHATDVAALTALWSDPEVTRHLGGPRDPAELRQRFEEAARAEAQPELDLWPLVERESGRVVGHCGLLEKEVDGSPEVELTYVLAADCWGRGYATEVARALRDHALERLRLRRLIALIAPENAASARVAEKVGMRLERETRRPGGKLMHVYALDAGSPAG